MWYKFHTGLSSIGDQMDHGIDPFSRLKAHPLPHLGIYLEKNLTSIWAREDDVLYRDDFCGLLIQLIQQEAPQQWADFRAWAKRHKIEGTFTKAKTTLDNWWDLFDLKVHANCYDFPYKKIKSILLHEPGILNQVQELNTLKDLYEFGISTLTPSVVKAVLSHPLQSQLHESLFPEGVSVSVPVAILMGEWIKIKASAEQGEEQASKKSQKNQKSVIKSPNAVCHYFYYTRDLPPSDHVAWHHLDWTRLENQNWGHLSKIQVDAQALQTRMIETLEVAARAGHPIGEQDLKRVIRTVKKLQSPLEVKHHSIQTQLFASVEVALRGVWLHYQFKSSLDDELENTESESVTPSPRANKKRL